MELTQEQNVVADAMLAFARKGESGCLTIGGWAGTGKTTLTAEVVKALDDDEFPQDIAFCCYTGKAASVLRSKLERAGVMRENRFCGTIHSLIYRPVDPDDPNTEWRRVDSIDASLIIIDEASMVNKTIFDDIASYNIPIIAVGDHGQLPPISPPGEPPFNLMENPQFKLEKIHRQAEENPIIHLSMLARTTGEVPIGRHGRGVLHINGKNEALLEKIRNFDDTLLLCGMNKTRLSLNKAARRKLGIDKKLVDGSIPVAGDKVVCLRNNRKKRIFNGVSGYIRDIKDNGGFFYDVKIDMENGVRFNGRALKQQFGAETTINAHPQIPIQELRDLFDFGYALTVHKAQGSEAESVLLFAERSSYMTDETWRKWFYTGITRARTYLTIVNRRFDKIIAKQKAAQMDKAFNATIGGPF